MPAIDLGLIITGTNRATSGLRAAGSDVDELGNHVKKLGENSQATANRLKAIEVVIGGILLEKSIELTKAFVEMASKVQSVDIRMAAWAGGIQNADKIMDEFVSKVGAAGIDLDILGNSFIKLRAAGVGMDQAKETIINLVNGIAAVGGNDLGGKLEAAATAFQRFAAKGVVSTRELNAIINSTGLTVGELAKHFGKAGITTDAFWDGLKNKTLSAQQLLDAFNAAAEQKFKGFASLLTNTVGGAISQFKADLDKAFGSLGGAGVDVTITAFIQELDKSVTDFIKNLSPEDVANFFQIFKDAEPTLEAVGNLIVLVGKAVTIALDTAFQLSNLLPPDATEFGIIGYVLLGKKGAILAGLIGIITGQLGTLRADIIGIAASYDKIKGSGYLDKMATLDAASPNTPLTNWFEATAGALAHLGETASTKAAPQIKSLMDLLNAPLTDKGKGSDDFISRMQARFQAIQDGLKKLSEFKVGGEGLGEPPVNDELAAKLAALRAETEALLSSTAGKDQLLQFQTAGDELGAKMQQIVNQTAGWNQQLDIAAVKIGSSKLPLDQKIEITKRLGDLQKQINIDSDAALVQARVLNGLKQAQLAIEQQIAQAQANEAARQLGIQSQQRGSPSFSALSATNGGALSLQVDQQRVEYAQKILDYNQQIKGLEAKAQTDTANAGKYRTTEAAIQNLMDKTKEFAANLNADTELQTQFFAQLGQQMESDVASGLSGLIQGTMSWGDVGRKVFGDLIDLSIKYLIQLAEIKLMSAFFGAAADGAVVPGGVKPFANGGVPITPFANGGLTTGPTLFGLMGEAGTEAIMPLTRIGGKLGVHATGGGGGNQYHITVQAIDTQTGLSFIGKHIGNIDAGLRARQQLNRK